MSAGRSDIQGLRAVAVLAVIVDHICAWPGGGFVGVDVFFVVSGFLITGLLLRQHEKTGHISLVEFYRRRVKRILPASALVLIATVIAGYGVLRSQQISELRVDAWWSLLFSANWRFGLQETDYFNLDRSISPLQHYWSLSIEEQFYFVWPWVMLVVLTIFARRSARITLVTVMAVIIVASFVYAIMLTRTDPDAAYFSSFTRVWELGVGAALAIAIPLLHRIPDAIRPVLAWAGLGGLAAGFWLIEGERAFPAPAAALPVVATALIIAAGTYRDPRQQQRRFWILTNRGAAFVGDISYSLYLWHFPVIILFGVWYGEADGVFYTTTVLMIAGLSIASYYIVEEPLRHLPWRFDLPNRRRSSQRRNRRRWSSGHNWKNAKIATGCLIAAMAVALSTLALSEQSIETSETAEEVRRLQAEASTMLNTDAAALTDLEHEHQDAILQALQSSTFPDLHPGLDTLTTQQWIDSLTDGTGCSNVSADNVEECVFGPTDAPKTAVLMGDSYAIAWMPAVREALTPQYRVIQITSGQCPTWGVPILKNKGEPYPECEKHLDWALRTTAEAAPDLVIVAQSDAGIKRVPDPVNAIETVTRGFTAVLNQLRASGSQVVVLSAPPPSTPLQRCVTRASTPEDCVSEIDSKWIEVSQAEEAASDAAGARYLDTRSWFCAFDRCPGWVGTTPVRADGFHMTLAFSATLAPLLREALAE